MGRGENESHADVAGGEPIPGADASEGADVPRLWPLHGLHQAKRREAVVQQVKLAPHRTRHLRTRTRAHVGAGNRAALTNSPRAPVFLRKVLHGAWCMLHGANCMLHGACCMLHIARGRVLEWNSKSSLQSFPPWLSTARCPPGCVLRISVPAAAAAAAAPPKGNTHGPASARPLHFGVSTN